jgi:hypothetical protein
VHQRHCADRLQVPFPGRRFEASKDRGMSNYPQVHLLG